jgi:hypothetical protein
MKGTRVEIHNHVGAGAVIVARFETSGDSVGTMQIAGGGSQRFEEFDRLTVSAPEATGDLRLLNHGDADLKLWHETASGHVSDRMLDQNGFDDIKVAKGDQLYITAAAPAHVMPERPHLHHAVFEPRFPPPIYAPNQQPVPFVVRLGWSHPDEGSDALLGYNLYRGFYNGNHLDSYHVMNGPPHIGTFFKIEDVHPPYPYNHRYSITAISRDGVESRFSNVRILDANTAHHLIDAGYIQP